MTYFGPQHVLGFGVYGCPKAGRGQFLGFPLPASLGSQESLPEAVATDLSTWAQCPACSRDPSTRTTGSRVWGRKSE